MKFCVIFKTPGAVDFTVENIVKSHSSYDRENCCNSECGNFCVRVLADKEEKDLEEEMRSTLDKFIKNNEYITIQFDTEDNTAKVIELN